MQDEVPQLRRALANVGGEQYAPKLTLVVVQKRHNTRLFPDNVDRVRQNVTPGTVIDTTIVHPNYTEFYLLAHRSPQVG
jgi:eukaryotic translation initiation factor 2C